MDGQHWRPIAETIQRHGWKHGAEVGVFKAVNIAMLLGACPELHMIGVDTWPCEETFRRARQRIKPFRERVKFIRGTSVQAAAWVPDRSLDFVFIDADHEEASVKTDIRTWREKLNCNGILMGHDIHMSAVRRAVEDLIGAWDELPFNVWIEK